MNVNRRQFLAWGAGGVVLAGAAAGAQAGTDEDVISAEVCVYGGNASGVISAVAASREGCSVVLVEPGRWLGGMTGGGIDEIDWGRSEAVGGSARHLLGRPRPGTSGGSQERFGNKDYRERLNALVKQHDIEVVYEHRLSEVDKQERVIQSLVLEHAPPGKTGIPASRPLKERAKIIRARMFIDCSYEGDLMAKAGVSYTFGRESAEQYGESLNGVRPILLRYDIDPWRTPGDPASGLIPLLQDLKMNPLGGADRLTMAYCFRFGFDFNPGALPITPTEAYDPGMFEVFRRGFRSGVNMTTDRMMKNVVGNYIGSDAGAKGPFTNNIRRCLLTHVVYGSNREYPDGDWATRAAIWQFHQDHIRNLAHFMRTDPAVPPDLQEAAKQVGLVAGDFDDTAGWPHQLYVREARRMVSSYVVTQNDIEHKRSPEDPVGLASYGIDDFPFATIADQGQVALSGGEFSILYLGEGIREFAQGSEKGSEEGLFLSPGAGMYKVPYRSITPREEECQNLFVPVCCSASHIVMTSLRMEPVWMVLGESAGVAAAMALRENVSVQQLEYATLRRKLLKLGQVLEIPA